jgi:solute carrier family 35 protein E3
MKTTGRPDPIAIPPAVLVLFTTVCVISIAGSQLSLKLNSVGFFQISKLGQVALTCFLERVLLSKKFSISTVCSIVVVISGVAITCFGSVLLVSAAGAFVACLAVFAASLQQLALSFLQTRYCLSSNELVAQTFYLQAIVLLGGGPLVDWWLVNSFPTAWLQFWDLADGAVYLSLSCIAAIFVNYSQIICIKQLSATGFQVLGNAKTVCILLIGFLYFDGKVSQQTVLGQGVAVLGMFLYGFSTSRGK